MGVILADLRTMQVARRPLPKMRFDLMLLISHARLWLSGDFVLNVKDM